MGVMGRGVEGEWKGRGERERDSCGGRERRIISLLYTVKAEKVISCYPSSPTSNRDKRSVYYSSANKIKLLLTGEGYNQNVPGLPPKSHTSIRGTRCWVLRKQLQP